MGLLSRVLVIVLVLSVPLGLGVASQALAERPEAPTVPADPVVLATNGAGEASDGVDQERAGDRDRSPTRVVPSPEVELEEPAADVPTDDDEADDEDDDEADEADEAGDDD